MLDRVWKPLLVTMALGSATAGLVFAQISPESGARIGSPAAPGGSSTPTAQGAAAVGGQMSGIPPTSAICRQTCEGTTATLAFQTTQGVRQYCPVRPQVVLPCAPYACNAGAQICRSTCAANAECAPGFQCSAGSCVPRCTSCGGTGESEQIRSAPPDVRDRQREEQLQQRQGQEEQESQRQAP
jgi:hypothetical protein